MKRITRNPKFYFPLTLGVLLGLTFPFAFVILDLKQLGLTFNFNNMFEIFKSQNIYIFSTILFPILFGAIGGLFFYISDQSKKMADQGRYVKNVLDSINDAICVCDSSGKIAYANKGYLNLYENGKNSIGQLLNIQEISQSPQGQSYELSLQNIKGEKTFVSYAVHKLISSQASDHKDQYIISIKDIQKLKQNEEIIISQREQLFEASKLSSLGEMAAGFAHEINNPLAIIQGRLKISQRAILKDEIDKDATLKNIDICLKTVDRVAKIILSLKNLAHRTDSQLDDDEVTIKSLIEDPITVANMKINGKDIAFTVEADDIGEGTIVCNSVQISQVLMNFIANSIDAVEGQSKPWLKLAVEVNASDAIFTITDSGGGIPMEIQKKMFEPMFTTKTIGKGTGLGLSISHSIIEKHNGKITIDNSVPNTCFVITIPRKKQIKSVAA